MWLSNNFSAIIKKGIIWITSIWKNAFLQAKRYSLHIKVNIDNKIFNKFSMTIDSLGVILKSGWHIICRECICPDTLMFVRSTKMKDVTSCVIVLKHLPTLFMLSEDNLIHILWGILFSLVKNGLHPWIFFCPTLPKIGYLYRKWCFWGCVSTILTIPIHIHVPPHGPVEA